MKTLVVATHWKVLIKSPPMSTTTNVIMQIFIQLKKSYIFSKTLKVCCEYPLEASHMGESSNFQKSGTFKTDLKTCSYAH